MTFVIKIKYGENLRRVTIQDRLPGETLLSFAQLESSIRELFQLQASDQFVVTYTDRDYDVVTMANDQDVVDALVHQSLNPLRLSVTLKSTRREVPGSSHPFLEGLASELPGAVEEAIHAIASKFGDALRKGAVDVAMFPAPEWGPGHSAQPEQQGPKDTNVEGTPADDVIHYGVRCDVCQMNPLVGSRWKSTKKPDYDLCDRCFEKVGIENEYMKIEQPMFRRGMMRMGTKFHPMAPNICQKGRPFGMRGPQGRHSCPAMGGYASRLDARCVRDVTMFSGTEVAPGTSFTKIWSLRNNGTDSWPAHTSLVLVGGDEMSQVSTVPIEIPEQGLAPEGEMEVSVDLVAPEKLGRSVSHWRLATADGQKFGHCISVHIQVVPRESLDQPAVAMEDTVSKAIEPRYTVDEKETHGKDVPADGAPAPSAALEKKQDAPIAIEVMEIEEENASKGAEEPKPAPTEGRIAYPVLEVTRDAGPITYPVIDPVIEPTAPPKDDVSMTETGKAVQPGPGFESESLSASMNPLAKLRAMGFLDEQLNSELLEKNAMDLRKTLDDLCTAEEWEPLLQQLGEMGFYDANMNRRLMFKNSGSVKLVVKDLVQMYKDPQRKGKSA